MFKYEPSENAKKVIKIIMVVWFIIPLFVLRYLPQDERLIGWFLLFFGSIMFGECLLSIYLTSKEERTIPAFIFPFLGIPFITVGIGIIVSDDELVEKIYVLLPFLFLGMFFLIGLFIAVWYPVEFMLKKKRCTVKVNAVVVEYMSKKDSSNSVTTPHYIYSPVFEYHYNGEKYKEYENYYSSVGMPRIGRPVTILINENNPKEVLYYDKRRYQTPIFIGICFMLVSATMALQIIF